MPNRGVRALIAAGVIVLAAALVVPLLLSDSSPLRQQTPVVTPAPPVSAATSVPLPPSGAYVGAWVKPEKNTEQGRIDAVEDFERQTGRRLDIVHHYHTWDDFFPSEFDLHFAKRANTTLLLSWASADTREIVAGKHDRLIRLRATDLKELKVPVLMQWRWEMDRPNLASIVHEPEDYIAAWKRIRSLFHEEGTDNIDWVWCPLSEGFGNGRAPRYYPGDEQVDWLCADSYAVTPDVPLEDGLEPFFAWAKSKKKPIMIGEFGTQPGADGERARWLAEVGQMARRNPQLKALVYFDSNVDRDGRKRDWSLRSHPEDVEAYGDLMAEPYFNPRKLRSRGG
jgi:Glycosyl hydrolase family 26